MTMSELFVWLLEEEERLVFEAETPEDDGRLALIDQLLIMLDD
jgi:hypothetical protein